MMLSWAAKFDVGTALIKWQPAQYFGCKSFSGTDITYAAARVWQNKAAADRETQADRRDPALVGES